MCVIFPHLLHQLVALHCHTVSPPSQSNNMITISSDALLQIKASSRCCAAHSNKTKSILVHIQVSMLNQLSQQTPQEVARQGSDKNSRWGRYSRGITALSRYVTIVYINSPCARGAHLQKL
jgi:hypothetical protein